MVTNMSHLPDIHTVTQKYLLARSNCVYVPVLICADTRKNFNIRDKKRKYWNFEPKWCISAGRVATKKKHTFELIRLLQPTLNAQHTLTHTHEIGISFHFSNRSLCRCFCHWRNDVFVLFYLWRFALCASVCVCVCVEERRKPQK